MFKKIAASKKFYIVWFNLFCFTFSETKTLNRDAIINEICKVLYENASQSCYSCIGEKTLEKKQAIYQQNEFIIKNNAVNVLNSKAQPFGCTADKAKDGKNFSLNDSMIMFCDIVMYALYYGHSKCNFLKSVIKDNEVYKKFGDILRTPKMINDYFDNLNNNFKTGETCNFFNILNRATSYLNKKNNENFYDEKTVALFFPYNEKDAQTVRSDFNWYIKNWNMKLVMELIIEKNKSLEASKTYSAEVLSNGKTIIAKKKGQKRQLESQNYRNYRKNEPINIAKIEFNSIESLKEQQLMKSEDTLICGQPNNECCNLENIIICSFKELLQMQNRICECLIKGKKVLINNEREFFLKHDENAYGYLNELIQEFSCDCYDNLKIFLELCNLTGNKYVFEDMITGVSNLLLQKNGSQNKNRKTNKNEEFELSVPKRREDDVLGGEI